MCVCACVCVCVCEREREREREACEYMQTVVLLKLECHQNDLFW